jgi:hypothetical protein
VRRRCTCLHARREHDADHVYVTGTFDDWRKTVKLENDDGIFKKTVELPKTHTQYKVRASSAALRLASAYHRLPTVRRVC